MRSVFQKCVALILVAGVTGCAPGVAPAAQSGSSEGRPTAPQPTIILASRGEPDSLAIKAFAATNGNFVVESIFNATMLFTDEQAQSQPFLSRDVPQLNTSSWTIAPDGKMVTTFNLKPNLTWHDGHSLTAEDFAFAHQVYSTPELGASRDARVRAVEGIDTPSPTTVVIRWRQPFPDALESGGFWILPKHILEEPLRTLDAGGFVSLPFWLQDYVGAGAYKVVDFKPGEHIEMAAFDGYALGRPKIDKMRMVFIANAPTGVANLLAGTIHFAASFVIGPDDGVNLTRNQWADGKGGEVLWSPTTIRMALIQWRPEYQDPKALSDLRVRRALAYAWDTQQAIDELNYGQGIKTATITPPTVPYYAEIERVISKYNYDPRMVGQILNQVGYTRGSDGFYADRTGTKLSLGVWSSSGDKNVQEAAFYVDGARKAGVDAHQEIASVQQLNDGMYRATASGISIRGGGSYTAYITSEVARPDNRWAGGNRSGYSNPVYDQLYDQYVTTLDPTQRISILAQLEKVFTEDVPAIMQYFQNTATARVSGLKGPRNTAAPGVGGGVLRIHEWYWEG